jgi:surface protein
VVVGYAGVRRPLVSLLIVALVVSMLAAFALEAVADAESSFVEVPAVRVLDTREGVGSPQAPLGARESREVQVAGVGGLPEDLIAVLVEVTASDAAAGGGVTIWPAGQDRPKEATLRPHPRRAVSVETSVEVGEAGGIVVFNQARTVQLAIDVVGYRVADESSERVVVTSQVSALRGTTTPVVTDPPLESVEWLDAAEAADGIGLAVGRDGQLRMDVGVSASLGVTEIRAVGSGCVLGECEVAFELVVSVSVVDEPGPGELAVAVPSSDRVAAAVPLTVGFEFVDEIQVLLGTDSEPGDRPMARAVALEHGLTLLGGVEWLGVYQLLVADAGELDSKLAGLTADPRVADAWVGTFGDVAFEQGSGAGDDLARSWHLDQIDAAAAIDLVTAQGGHPAQGRVGVIDTGVDWQHNDLNVVYRFPDSGRRNHGTHVAGMACARVNSQAGVAGVAPGCGILSGDAEYFTPMSKDKEGMWIAVQAAIGPVLHRGADAINISIGGYEATGCASPEDLEVLVSTMEDLSRYASSFERIFSRDVSRDTVWTVAAGNGCSNLPVSPVQQVADKFDNVLVVAATNSDRSLASFSDWGRKVDVAAPGGVGVGDAGDGTVGVYSTRTNNTHGPDFGTSYAAPVVAGVVALMRAAAPSISASDAAACITGTSKTSVTTVSSKPNYAGTHPQASDGLPPIPLVHAPSAVACAIATIAPPTDPDPDDAPRFVTTWDTRLTPDTTAITLLFHGDVDVDIDWGDGTTRSNVTREVSHTYAADGIYTVTTTGTFAGYGGQGREARPRALVSVDEWGATDTTDLSWAFAYAQNLIAVAPPPSTVTNMSAMFNLAIAFNQPIVGWDTSNVTDMSGMFHASGFNQAIVGWDTSNVTDMSWMFTSLDAFNQPIGDWDTSNVTNMEGMFTGALSFNQNIGDWDTSNVTDMEWMFGLAPAFNQPIGGWDTSKVTNMEWMFALNSAFNQPIGDWDTSKVTTTENMFHHASAFNQPIGGWDTSNVTTMTRMFEFASVFNQPIGGWDTSNVTTMESMFAFAEAFNQDLSHWDVSQVINYARFDYFARAWIDEYKPRFAN